MCQCFEHLLYLSSPFPSNILQNGSTWKNVSGFTKISKLLHSSDYSLYQTAQVRKQVITEIMLQYIMLVHTLFAPQPVHGSFLIEQ